MRLRLLALAALLASAAVAGPPAAPVASAPFRWEGLARRNPGLVLFRSRWDAGTLELRDDLLRWSDSKDPGKNLILPMRRLTRHVLRCPGEPPAACTEWRVSTRTDVYVFREAPPAGGAVLRRAFDAVRAAYADIPSSEER